MRGEVPSVLVYYPTALVGTSSTIYLQEYYAIGISSYGPKTFYSSYPFTSFSREMPKSSVSRSRYCGIITVQIQ